MYSVSEACITALRKEAREERLYGQIHFRDGTAFSFTQDHLASGGCTVTRRCVGAEQLELGGVIPSVMEIAFHTKRTPFAFSGATIYGVYQIRLANGSWYDIPLGTFFVAESTRIGSGVRLTAYDALTKLDRRYYGQVLTGTPHEVITKIADLCGLDFRQTVGHFSSFPNADRILRIDSTSGCKTYRDCVKQVLTVIGAFGYMNPNSVFSARGYAGTVTQTLTNSHRYTMNASDYLLQHNCVVAQSVTGGVYTSSELSPADSNVTQLPLVIPSAACWNSGDSTDLQSRVENLANALSAFTYTPASWTMPGDPVMEPGDRIQHITDNGTFASLVTSIVWRFNGRTTVTGTGSNIALVTPQTKGSELPLKDYNGDGVIDMRDVDALRSLIVQETYTLEDDWNGDGEVNVKDVRDFRKLVQEYLGPLPNTSGATAGQYLVAESVDENGRIEAISSSDAPISYTEEDYGKVLSCSADGLVWISQGDLADAEGSSY